MTAVRMIIFAILMGTFAPLAAQDGNFLESFAETSEVSRSQLATLIESADVPVTIEGSASQPIRADELAHVIMQLGSYGDTLGYRLFPGPRYAIRRVRDERLYPDSPRLLSAGAPVDGTTTLQLIRPALTEAVVRPPSESETVEIATRTVSGRTRGPWFEWDVEQRGGVSYRSGEETSASEFSADTRLDTQLVFSSRAQLIAQLDAAGTVRDDTSNSADLRIPRARLDLFREPQGRGWASSLSLGRLDETAVVSDGIAARLSSAAVISSLSVGYTGAVAATLNRIPIAETDAPESRPLGEGQFSPQRIAIDGTVLFPEVFGRQNPSVAVLSLIDPAETDALTQVRLGLSGPLSISLFYDLSADIQFGTSSGWASRGSLRWYPDVSRTTQLEVSAAVAGSDRGNEEGYVALDDDRSWSAFPGGFTNLAATTVSYSARLGEPWLVSASSTLLNRIDSEGSVAESVGQPSSTSAVLGWEGGVELGIQPLPDLFFDLNSNIFIPATEAWGGAYADSARPIWTTGIEFTARL